MISNDASRWPLVVVRVDGTATTREQVLDFIASQRSMLARNQPFVEIADSRGAMNAVLSIKSPSFPMHMCGTEEEVVRFLSDAARADGRIPDAPSSLQRWRLRPTG